MPTHLYEIGDVVSLDLNGGQFYTKLNPFTVEAQMPPVGNSLQYRIQSKAEPFKRVVPEHQLSSLDAPPQTPAAAEPDACSDEQE